MTVLVPAKDIQYQEFFRWTLAIGGIEVSQATQFFQASEHLTDPADRQADNAVRLVASKPAWVRVYVWSLLGSLPVTGHLEVRRRSGGFFFGAPILDLAPESASMTSTSSPFASYASTRGALSGSLDFIIPGPEMIGTLRLTAKVTAGSLTREESIDVAVTLRQRLRLAGVMISYNGPASMAPNAPNLQLAAPAITDLQAMSGTALTLFPVEPTAAFRTAGTLTLTNHLQDTSFPTSGCGTGWNALHASVENARTADGNQAGWIYYGLIPAGTPRGPVGGCGGNGVAVGPTGEPWTLAHEAGHACGLEHAPSGGAPNPDPSYPAYEPYDPAGTPQGSIGEYGIDINNGNIASPQTFRDLMGYAWPKWISPYHYGRLLNNATLNPTTVGVDHFWWRDLVYRERLHWPPDPPGDPPPWDLELRVYPPSELREVISLIVQVDDGKVAAVPHVARLRAYTELPGGSATSLRAVLRNAEGSVVATGNVVKLRTHACGCGDAEGDASSTYLAQAFLPDVGAGAVLEISDGDEVVWRRMAPDEPPKLGRVTAKVDRAGNIDVAWEASEGVDEFWVRWSSSEDDWRSVATDVHEDRVRVAAGQLPAGKGRLQVVAHDGFFSAYSEPVSVTIPDRPAAVVILHPQDGASVLANQRVRLWASVTDVDGDADIDARWLLDAKEIARGLDAWASFDEGEHTLTVRLAGARGHQPTVKVSAISPQGAEEQR